MAQEKKYIPELRFPEFINDEGWTIKVLDDILFVNSGKDYKHLGLGDIPVYGTGGYMLSVDDKLSEIDAIGIGRKGTIDKPQYLKAPFWTVDTLFFLTNKEGYDIQFLYYLSQTIDWKKYSEQGVLPSLSKSTIESIKVVILNNLNDSIAEQKKVARCLSSLDDCIEATNHKLRLLKEYKKGLMQYLFPTKGKMAPVLRFPEFQNTEEWSIKTLGTIGDTYGGLFGKCAEDFGTGKIYVTYKQVFDSSEIDPAACLQVRIEDNEKQNTLQYGDVLVTMSSETPEEIGYTAVVTNKNIPECYLNSFCFIYRLFDNESIDVEFLIYLFSSEAYRAAVVRIAQGITRFNISKIKFKEIELAIPETKDEQRKIATILSSIDKQIAEYDKKIKAFELHKKGLMQQLFPKL